MDRKHAVLKEYFGHSEFRSGQGEVIDSLLSGRDVLCVMPTGAGKSICYEVPAMLLEGITVVVSPLISLMRDQVSALCEAGIPAAFLNSSLTPAQYSRALFNMTCGKYKLIYVAPERLASPEFEAACESVRISLLAVDEAHCISQWGQDFRPSYLRIPEFIERLGYRPILGAFTATATERVKEDIERALSLASPYRITTGFDRPNLSFSVLRPESKNRALLELLGERRERSGIVYCSTRRNVDEVTALLISEGYSAAGYHAGMGDDLRRKNQEDFVFDRVAVMVATNAFGMGIDKSNVSYVIHYNMPKDIESYYQEAGRAGRDGADAECILLYSPADVKLNEFLIERAEPNSELGEGEREHIREKELERLRRMTFYSTANTCLRAFILGYFGESAPSYCGNCSSCLGDFIERDVSLEVQKILSCIKRTGERFGKKMIVDVLRGAGGDRLFSLGLDRLSTYGIMRESSAAEIYEIIGQLEFEGYISTDGGKYPILRTTSRADSLLFEGDRIVMRLSLPKAESSRSRTPAREKKPSRTARASAAGVDLTLFGELRALRKKIADGRGIPAFVVFTDATLIDICTKHPKTRDELLAVSGVGKQKADLYAADFLEVLRKY